MTRTVSRLRKVVVAALAAPLAGAAALVVTMFPIVYPEPLPEQIFAGAIYLACIAGTLWVLGIPLYVAAWRFEVPTRVSGLVLGFILGMMGSLGYASIASLHNFLLGVCTFGFSGLVTAAVFLWAVGERLTRDKSSTAIV